MAQAPHLCNPSDMKILIHHQPICNYLSQVPLNQAQPPQIEDQHNIPVFNPMTINMKMNTINEMNTKLEKLSLLDELNNRIVHIEQK